MYGERKILRFSKIDTGQLAIGECNVRELAILDGSVTQIAILEKAVYEIDPRKIGECAIDKLVLFKTAYRERLGTKIRIADDIQVVGSLNSQNEN
jgi:hypothetical protein